MVSGMLYCENCQRSLFSQKGLTLKGVLLMGMPLCQLILLLLFAEFLLCVRRYASYYENLSLILKVTLKNK